MYQTTEKNRSSPDLLVGSSGLAPHSTNKQTKISTKSLTIQFSFSHLYLNVVEFHAAAIRCCQRCGELDLLGQLTPLPTLWFGALNLRMWMTGCVLITPVVY